MIDEFYGNLLNDDVERIILIGPNHSAIGPKIQVGIDHYGSHNGVVKTDMITRALLSFDDVYEADPEMVASEHSIGIHMNYIGHYYKDVPVCPIYVHESSSHDDVIGLVEIIYELLGEKNSNTIVIGSVDFFSHYLTLEEAKQKDLLSYDLMINGDYEAFF